MLYCGQFNAEFATWATAVAGRHGYQVRLVGMGEEAEGVGGPSQMAVFNRQNHRLTGNH